MDRRTFLFSGGVLLLAPALMSADDFTGKWSGSFVITSSDGEKKDAMAFMDLKQKGAEITGTAGESPDKQWAIQNGKVDGNKITFEVQTDGPLVKLELALVDGHLKGEAIAEHEGKSMKAAVDLQRQKD
ncbi:MAG TPA: hypothetical protein VG324_28790 [Blastocatellia bacterium]|nr:hypothetical protein [Blastocatellia bacterium]